MAKQAPLKKKKASHKALLIKSPQPSTKHKQANVHLSNQRMLDRFAAAHSFKYLRKEGVLAEVEQKLFIAPVSLLGHHHGNEQCFGIFANENLEPKGSTHSISRRLGEYLGQSVQCVNADDYDGDTAYLFVINETELGFSKAIDAKSERNWTAIVNSASCSATSNIGVYIDHGNIYYYLKRPIKAGEQLLIYYGDLYNSYYANLPGGMRFLKPTDSSLESYDLFQQHKTLYQPELQLLDASLAQLFEINLTQQFVIPTVGSLSASHVDLPLLAYDPSTQQLLPQHEQENMTSLMLACWDVDVARVRGLLERGANPNIQSSIYGLSALHLVIARPTLNDQTKKTLVKLLVEYHAEMHLQDKHERSILHWALRAGNVSMVKFLIEENELHKDEDEENSLLDCVDKDNYDVFLLAIAQGSFELVYFIKSYITEDDLDIYLNDNSLKGALERLLDHVSDLTEINRIFDALKSIPMSNAGIRVKLHNQLTASILTNIQRACILDVTGQLPDPAHGGVIVAQTQALAVATHFFAPQKSVSVAPAVAKEKTSRAGSSKKNTSTESSSTSANEYGRFYPARHTNVSVVKNLRKNASKMRLRSK